MQGTGVVDLSKCSRPDAMDATGDGLPLVFRSDDCEFLGYWLDVSDTDS